MSNKEQNLKLLDEQELEEVVGGVRLTLLGVNLLIILLHRVETIGMARMASLTLPIN